MLKGFYKLCHKSVKFISYAQTINTLILFNIFYDDERVTLAASAFAFIYCTFLISNHARHVYGIVRNGHIKTIIPCNVARLK